ncbi:hypothetical protein ACFY5H_18310 [Streptomyces sp. NPDC013012]|uniref:hypothetical protein n=1 Tax=Streptomyces sp. NPDC013012 TaxID=3364860 RepID=UPI003674748D
MASGDACSWCVTDAGGCDAAPDRAERTNLTWLEGMADHGVRAHLPPSTSSHPHTRMLGLDAVRGRVKLLDAPHSTPEWIALPRPVDPSNDCVRSAAFTTLAGNSVLLTGTRPIWRRESSVAGRHDRSAEDETPRTDVTKGRLWDVSMGTPGRGTPLELLSDVCLLLPHHAEAGTRWVAQQEREGTTEVIDLSTDSRYQIRLNRPVAGPRSNIGHQTISEIDVFLRWTSWPTKAPSCSFWTSWLATTRMRLQAPSGIPPPPRPRAGWVYLPAGCCGRDGSRLATHWSR